tara:strand:- start:152 stop:706 length:555 start_codon:yes stop_codon:yes gene_type:complete
MEEDFFIKKMKGVKPLKNKTRYISKKKTIQKRPTNTKTSDINIVSEKAEQKVNKPKKDLDIAFGEINKDLKRGKIKIDRRLDLHGYSVLSARQTFKEEVLKLFDRNKRCLLVITGKGVHLKSKNTHASLDDNKPQLYYGKIKNSIISWVKEDDIKKYVLTYQNAGLEHGGDGAIFIYLRKKTNL